MEHYHNKSFTIDADNSALVSPVTKPYLIYGDNALLRWTVQHNDKTPFDLSGYAFRFGLDYTFLTNNTDLVTADSSKFIAGDWDEYNVATGKICCRVNFKTNALFTYLAEYNQKNTIASLWAIGTPNLLLVQFNCITSNLIFTP